MTSLSTAYMFTCLGFCLGFVVCSIFRATPNQTDADDQLPLGGYQPRAHRGPVAPPPRKP